MSLLAITERRDMGLYEVQLSLLGFGDYVSELPYVVLCCCSEQFQHAREECESKRYLIGFSGHCELLFLPCFIASWTSVVVSVMLYPCIFCVALLIDMFVLCVACL